MAANATEPVPGRDILEAQFSSCQRQLPPLDEEWLTNPAFGRFSLARSPLRMLQSYPDEAEQYDWPEVPSMADVHADLWRRARIPQPDARAGIMLFRQSSHWATVHESLVATRMPDGQWKVQWVRAVNAQTRYEEIATGAHILTQERSEALDVLLADPCLQREPTSSEWSPLWSSANWQWTVEFGSFANGRIVAGAHDGFGRTGLIHDLILFPPPVENDEEFDRDEQ